MIIRLYEPADFEPVTRLWRRAREVAVPELTERMGYSFAMDVEHFRDHIVASCELWVAEAGGSPVAFMGRKVDFMDYLYVNPDFHRQGIGRLLLDHARSLSPAHLWLCTHQSNRIARGFYERNGFVAEKFGVSAAPEGEPDIEYHWRPATRSR